MGQATRKSFAELEIIDEFNDYLDAHEIDDIITTHDTVALFLAEHK